MDKSLHQVESLPESFIPGGVYFDKETGGVYIAQDSSTKKQFGGTVTDISAPKAAGSFTASNPGVNAVQKVSITSSKGSFDVVTSIVYINGAKLAAMDDGDTISYGGSLFSFLQSNLVQGKLFMLSTTGQGDAGFGGRPVVVESLGSTYVISLVSYGTPYNKIIRWTVTSSNQVTRNDTVLTSSGGGSSASADIIIDESLLQESSGPASEEPELVTLLKPYIQAVNSGTTQIPKLFVKKKSTAGAGTTDMYMLYPASFQGNTGEVDGQFIMYPGVLSYYGSGSDGTNLFFYGVTIMYAASTFMVQNLTSFQLPSSGGNSSLVLAQNGTWRSLPASITVDSALSSTSTNPVQNKAITVALEEKGDIIIIDNDEYMDGPISSEHRNALKSAGKMLYVRIPAGEIGGTMYMSFMPCSYIYNTTALYISRFEPITGGTRLFMKLYNKDTGVLEESHAVVLKSDGDGTKFLNDQGEYTAPPKQERGTVVFFSDGLSESTVGKGMKIPKSSLKPTGITPIIGKDIVIQVTVGVIGLITSSDVQNYYLSYDNGTLLGGIINPDIT